MFYNEEKLQKNYIIQFQKKYFQNNHFLENYLFFLYFEYFLYFKNQIIIINNTQFKSNN